MQNRILATLALTIATVYPSLGMDEFKNYQDSQQNLVQLREIVEEDYQGRFVEYRQNALNTFKSNCYITDTNGQLTIHPNYKLSESFLGSFEDIGGWATAIANFQQVMTIYHMPSVDNWAVRGFAKKYNERLLREINANVDSQKDALLRVYQGY